MLTATKSGARSPTSSRSSSRRTWPALVLATGNVVFGAVSAEDAVPETAPPAEKAVVYTGARTMLGGGNHELAGVIASSDPRYARAIFVGPNNRQAVFGVGDEVSPGVRIDAIERDYVVLGRGGRPEALALRRSSVPPADVKLAGLSPDTNRGGAVAATGYDPVEERMARLRASISPEPPPLPPVSTVPLDIRRGRNSGKLPAAARNRR